jgi:hypothetical protein
MKPILFAAQVCLLVLLGVVSGVVHGRLTNRWGAPPELKAAGKTLATPPRACGDWKLLRTEEIGESTVNQLQCPGYLNAVYERQKKGAPRDVVRVAILVGPAGPIAVHTPEICYANVDYELSDDRKPAEIGATRSATGQSANELWRVTLKSRGVDGYLLRVYYGWSVAGDWRASKRPRIEFAGQPYLYKIQAAAVLPSALPGQEAPDPCREFLTEFLPAIQDRISP